MFMPDPFSDLLPFIEIFTPLYFEIVICVTMERVFYSQPTFKHILVQVFEFA